MRSATGEDQSLLGGEASGKVLADDSGLPFAPVLAARTVISQASGVCLKVIFFKNGEIYSRCNKSCTTVYCPMKIFTNFDVKFGRIFTSNF